MGVVDNESEAPAPAVELSGVGAGRNRWEVLISAVKLVELRHTTDIPLSDIVSGTSMTASEAEQTFGDRDGLIVAAAMELLEQGELRWFGQRPRAMMNMDNRLLAVLKHMAGHRAFYRAVLLGTCNWQFTVEVMDHMAPVNRTTAVHQLKADPEVADDLALFITGGVTGFVHTWIVDADDPLDPEELLQRLVRLQSFLFGAPH